RLSDGYDLSLGHHFPLSDGNALTGYEWVGNPGFAFLVFDPLDIFFGILFPVFPRTRVVLKLELVDHYHPFLIATHLRPFAAADAILVLDVVEAVRGRIEALVRAFDPAESTFGAEIESDRGSLRLGGAALEHGISRLSLRTHLEPALDCRNRGALLH